MPRGTCAGVGRNVPGLVGNRQVVGGTRDVEGQPGVQGPHGPGLGFAGTGQHVQVDVVGWQVAGTGLWELWLEQLVMERKMTRGDPQGLTLGGRGKNYPRLENKNS